MSDREVENVGILAAEVYFPSTYVSQDELEKFDQVTPGKYTKGLGQSKMAFCGDREDINSICLTVVHNLLEKYNIPMSKIGRLEVGTETLVDKSKSVKTTLMTLFEQSGNSDIEGVDNINACYGGTAALFNAVNWIESKAWDGRYAIVVAADIAVYEPGPARPTGGVGAVAMVIGPSAPLSLVSDCRASHMQHVFDFYKPRMESEYPRVDGHVSNVCYLNALDNTSRLFSQKFEKKFNRKFNLKEFDYAIFHQPYQKLVQKSYARYFLHEYLNTKENSTKIPLPVDEEFKEISQLSKFEDLKLENTYENKEVEKVLMEVSKKDYAARVEPTTFLSNQLGNSYCGSLYMGLMSLIHTKASELPGKRVLMFSYGSGLAASTFMLKCNSSVEYIKNILDLENRLANRESVPPNKFSHCLNQREFQYNSTNYVPVNPIEQLFPKTYYLTGVDHLERRSYARREYSTLARANHLGRNIPSGVGRVGNSLSSFRMENNSSLGHRFVSVLKSLPK